MVFGNTNRLLSGLTKQLRKLQASLDNHAKAITEHQQANKTPAQPILQPIVVNSRVSLPPAVEGYYASEEKERPSKNRWERMKRPIEILAFLFAIALAVFTYLTLRQITRQADFAQVQAAVMQKQLDMTDRPWIKVTSATSIRGLEFTANQVHVGLRLKVKNVGRSVALSVTLKSKLIFPTLEHGPRGSFSLPVSEQKATCAGSGMQPGANHSLPFNLFPDEDSGDMMYVDTYQQIPATGAGLVSVPGDPSRTERVSPVYVGCVTYVIPISGMVHHTDFVYELGTVSGNPPIAKATKFRIGKNVSLGELVMMAFPFGGFDAN